MMFVTRNEVVIGLDPGDGDIPERSAYCDPINITRIEPLDSIKKKRSSQPAQVISDGWFGPRSGPPSYASTWV